MVQKLVISDSCEIVVILKQVLRLVGHPFLAWLRLACKLKASDVFSSNTSPTLWVNTLFYIVVGLQ